MTSKGRFVHLEVAVAIDVDDVEADGFDPGALFAEPLARQSANTFLLLRSDCEHASAEPLVGAGLDLDERGDLWPSSVESDRDEIELACVSPPVSLDHDESL